MSYYHLDEERVGFVNGSPTPSEKNLFWRYFWESHGGGHLHLIDIYRPGLTAFEVLEMGRDYSGWFVKYRVDLDPIFSTYPQLPWYFIVVLFIAREETDGEGSSSLLLHIPGKVISYNLRSNIYFQIF
ncbi:F-box protein [Rosa sericea]